jgi:alpha-glucosidase
MICLLTLIVGDVSAIKVTGVSVSISKKFDIDRKWYKKYTHVKGIPIISSKKVNSRALLKSAGVINKVLLGNRYKVSKYLKKYRAKMAIVDKGKNFSSLPEVSTKKHDKSAGLACCGKYKWDKKSGSWKLYYRLGMTREQNALQLPYPKGTSVGSSVITHEFAHVVHDVVLDNVYPKISKLITKTYKAAKKKKLWKGAYAMDNEFEYFAEGTERWFNVKTREVNSTDYFTTGGPHPKNREELKKHDIALYRLLKKIYGNGKWRFRYGRICDAGYTCDNNYKLSASFGPSLALAASGNAFMVGEDFDLKIASTGASFSFDDYSYIDIAQSSGKSWQLGFKAEENDTRQMGGNFAFGSQLGGIQYRVAADNTFLGSKGSGWLGYKDARSAYVNVGKRYFGIWKKRMDPIKGRPTGGSLTGC